MLPLKSTPLVQPDIVLKKVVPEQTKKLPVAPVVVPPPPVGSTTKYFTISGPQCLLLILYYN